MIGAGMKVNPCADTEPLGVVTRMSPLCKLKFSGIRSVICVGELTVNGTTTPPMLTAVVVKEPLVLLPLKFVPVSTTLVPPMPEVGVKFVMVGKNDESICPITKPPRSAMPVVVITRIVPEAAPLGTVA